MEDTGSDFIRRGCNRVDVGNKYMISVDVIKGWFKEYDLIAVDGKIKLTCVAKYPRYALFESDKGTKVCIDYFDLGDGKSCYEVGESLIL